MKQQPIVYLEYDFFKKLIDEFSKEFLFLKPKEYLTFLYNLIFIKSSIYIDLPTDKITEILTSEPNNLSEAQIKDLSFRNKLRPTKYKIKDYLSNIEYLNSSETPDYILADIDLNTSNVLNRELGLIVLSSDFTAELDNISKVKIFDFEAGIKVQIENIFKPLPAAKKIIIEDPYFYSESTKFLTLFINNLICPSLKRNPVEILIIIQGKRFLHTTKAIDDFDFGYKQLCAISKELEEKHGRNLNINIVYNNDYKMHDRHLISNSFWLTSGHSFKAKYNTNTSWVLKPIAIYYSEYQKRLNFATRVLNFNQKS